MEIDVPAGCKLAGYDLRTESLEVYEELLAACEHSYVPGGTTLGAPGADGIATQERRFFYYTGDAEDRVLIWVKGPAKRVKVTVEDA